MDNEKIKIFVSYHDVNLPLFKNKIHQPILTGAFEKEIKEGFVADNTGDNISNKNKNYGELTAQYWVWKNYLKENPQVEYIGFCHYRRFFDCQKRVKKYAFKKHNYKTYREKFFNTIDSNEVYESIKNYDIIMPATEVWDINCYDRFVYYHSKEGIDKAIEIIEKHFSEYVPYMEEYLNGKKEISGLLFIMKRELFEQWIEWIYKFSTLLEKELDLSKYNTYMTVRIFPYLAENFINFWIKYQIDKNNIKMLNVESYLLTHIGAKEYNFCCIKYFVEKNGEKYLNIFDFDIVLNFKRIYKWLNRHLIKRR